MLIAIGTLRLDLCYIFASSSLHQLAVPAYFLIVIVSCVSLDDLNLDRSIDHFRCLHVILFIHCNRNRHPLHVSSWRFQLLHDIEGSGKAL